MVDENIQLVNVPTTEGFVVELLTEEQRAIVSRLLHAVEHYRDTGETDQLEALRGTKVGFLVLETDPAKIEELFGPDGPDYEFYLDEEEGEEGE
jgi:hypothetical protein